MRIFLVIVFVGTLSLAFAGCSNLGYYLQAADGHLDIMSKRQPIKDLLDKPDLDADLRIKLELAQRARKFAVTELQLPDNDSYLSYADLEREYVTWNVIATQEFSVEAVDWCFLIVGCVPYRGYHQQQAAEEFAADLRAEGYEVFVNGASAYSTLGWFDDPLLNTMLRWQETRLVGVIFHELAHQQIWLEGDTTFNESFAVFVEREGVRRWLLQNGEQKDREDYEIGLQRQREFAALLQNARSRLSDLYATDASADEMRLRKRMVFTDLRADYQTRVKPAWQDYAGYDHWFSQEMNNSRFALVATYNDLVPKFAAIFEQKGSDFAAFYQYVKELAAVSAAKRERIFANDFYDEH